MIAGNDGMGARKFALIFVALLVSGVLGLSYSVQVFPLRLTDGDKTEIIKLTLERAIVAKEIPDYHMIEDKENMVLSTENIDPDLVSKISGVNLTLLDPDKIQEKADREGDFLFLRFKHIQINGWRVIVSLDNIWAIGKNSQSRYLSGGGFTIKYYRGLFGGWVGEGMAAWES